MTSLIRKISYSRIIPRWLLRLADELLLLPAMWFPSPAIRKFFNRLRGVRIGTGGILPLIQDTHWFWDTEVMVRAHFAGLVVKELPVVFNLDPMHESKVNLFKDSLTHFSRLLQFRKEIKQKFWNK